jgi:hypothetical protein
MSVERKASFLYHAYKSSSHGSDGLRRSQLKQLLDHIFFAVIYAVPNLAYHYPEAGYSMGSDKCERVMQQKLQMQRKGYTEKSNILKLMFAQGGAGLSEEEFVEAVVRHRVLDTVNLRQRLSSVIGGVTSNIGKMAAITFLVVCRIACHPSETERRESSVGI